MPESEKEAAYLEEYERYAAGGAGQNGENWVCFVKMDFAPRGPFPLGELPQLQFLSGRSSRTRGLTYV